jgi:hypothetical protein
MKNIYILPTDKPSRLHFDDKLFLSTKHQLSSSINSIVEGRNIYITSDEEIKGGDWVKNISFEEPIFKLDGKGLTYVTLLPHLKFKRVVLTTDQELIKDGVQAIDDEFLEWFVKNPSCESFEIRKEKYSERFDNDKSAIGNPNTWGNRWVIIIPKEEPKQETALEEAILQILTENSVGEEDMILSDTFPKVVNCMNEMAKWQQEQDKKMYSEEEVIELLQWLTDNSSIYSIMYGHKKYRFSTNDKDFTSKEILKQFKNK